MLPTGTSTVVSGHCADSRDRAAVGRRDAEVVAVQVDRVVVHRAQVAEADAHALAGLDDAAARCRGTPCALNVSTLKSVISFGSGRARAGLDLPLAEHEREVAVDAAAPRGSRGWTTNMPIMPERHLRHLVEVRVVHERAVLAERELVLERLARRIARWVSPPTPSMPFGRSTPCQCTVVGAGSRLVT